MNLDKLKDTARKHEQKEDWKRAIDVYLKAIQEFESGKDLHPDLSIYNRVGDLYLKVNDTAAAVRSYERAADLYTEQGFLNNAVALCGKILRISPGRTHTYYKLAQIHARKNMLVDAKRNLIEFLERMNASGELDAAFDALKVFADQFSSNQELRVMLIELLRAASREAEANEQIEKMASELEARGDAVGARRTRERIQAVDEAGAGGGAGGLIFLDTGVDDRAVAPPPRAAHVPPPPPPALSSDLQIIAPDPEAAATPPLPELEPVEAEEPPLEVVAPVDGLELVDAELEESVVSAEGLELDLVTDTALAETTPTLEGLEPTFEEHALSGGATAVTPDPDLILEPTVEDFGDAGTAPRGSLVLDEPTEPPMLEAEAGTAGVPDATLAELQPLEPLEPDADVRPTEAWDELPVDTGAGEAEEDAAAGPTALEAEPVEAEPAPYAESLETIELDEAAAPTVEAALPGALPTVAELEAQVAEDPDKPEPHRQLGEAYLLDGRTDLAIDEFELALAGYEFEDRREEAEGLLALLVTLEPENVRYYQKAVEYAYRSGDRERLMIAYLDLADVLMRLEAPDKAAAVYGRVLEHEPDNRRARAALEALAAAAAEPESTPPAVAPVPPPAVPGVRPAAWQPPAAPAEPAAEAAPPEPPPAAVPQADGSPLGFVDLGALVIDDEGPRDTRMKVGHEEPTGDEQRDFQEMLEQFKRGIDENIGIDDYEAHYDLGIAFKEMGLLDEAIAEFQKALRAPDGRLRTSEALGVCFFDKGQFPVAEAVLRRAVESLPGGDEEKIGLIYWLGRACEAQQRVADAARCYERAMAVDIRFMDLSDRVQRLGTR